MLTFKPEVSTNSPLAKLLLMAERSYAKYGYDCVVSSLNDGKHMPNSAHYANRAADLRSRHLKRADIPLIIEDMQMRLGPLYHIMFEPELKDEAGRITRYEHIHAQFGEKRADP